MIINQTYRGGIELSLVISVVSGSVVTATKGGKSVTGVSVDGVCVLMVPEAGVWTVSATLGGKITPAQTIQVVDQYAAALAYGTPLGELAVGSSVFANVGGVRTEFLVVHQGKPSDIYDDSCDGTWLRMRYAYEKKAWHSSDENAYAGSTIHAYLNGSFLALFDAALRTVIKQAKIPYRAGTGTGKTVTSGANGLSAKIFLLSGTEQKVDSSVPTDEGACLDYYASISTSVNNDARRIVYQADGTAVSHWSRSPNCLSSKGVTCATEIDEYGGSGWAKCSEDYHWICPVLILPSDVLTLSDGTISV